MKACPAMPVQSEDDTVEAGIRTDPTLCHSCGRWKPRRDDRYCAWCAAPLIIPQVDPSEILFSTEQGHSERILTLRNGGTNNLYAALEVSGSAAAVSHFHLAPVVPDNLYEIPGSGHLVVTLTFDAENLDADADYSATLNIDTNAPDETHTVALEVERPPVAVILPGEGARERFVVGDSAVLPVRIRNNGGGNLRVNAFRIEEPQDIASAQPGALEIASGAEATLEMPIGIEKLPAGSYVARARISFSNHPPMEFTREFTVAKPARIRIIPSSVIAELYPIARRDCKELELVNLGDERLEIKNVTSDQTWLKPLCRNFDVSPGGRGYVDLYIDAPDLHIGEHTGQLRIVSNSFGGDVVVSVLARVHDLPPLADPIGVDFGTSLSCVATVRDGDPILIDINPDAGNDSIEGYGLPSVVFFDENMFPIVGEVARERSRIDPSASVQSVKRLLGGKQSLRIRGKEFTPTEVTTEVFRSLLGTVERAIVERGSPRNAVLTIPADISDQQINEVLAAARMAGLAIEDGHLQEYVLDEPSAAALYYLWKSRKQRTRRDEKERIFIYDFGAGTLDCSLVQIEPDGTETKIRVLATTGDRQLGGNDVDNAIARFVAQRLQASHGFDPTPILLSRNDLKTLRGAELTRVILLQDQYREVAERMKIQLSSTSEAIARFPLSADQFADVALSLDEFNQITRPFLLRSRAVVEECCAQADIPADSVHTILHTGRGSAIRSIRASVNEWFPSAKDCSDFIEAKQCVALGAAWWAYIKNLPNIDIRFEGLSPKLPHGIGYLSVENFASVYKPIFRPGQSYPAMRSIQFPCPAGRGFELVIVEQRYGAQANPRSRGTIRLPAANTDRVHDCAFRLTPYRTLEVVVGGHTLEIDPHEDGSDPAL